MTNITSTHGPLAKPSHMANITARKITGSKSLGPPMRVEKVCLSERQMR